MKAVPADTDCAGTSSRHQVRMLLTLRTTARPATDLGFLLHKHPDHVQIREFPFGHATVFYPEASDDACTAAILLDVDPVGIVRGRSGKGGAEDQYVNDRPYVASSLLSVVLSRWFNSALAGRCERKPELVGAALPFEARIAAIPCRGGDVFLRAIFEPLGYQVEAARHELDERMPALGSSRLFTVTLRATLRLHELLTHLYVLIPVLDDQKHYWVGDDEVEKLLLRGAGWLAAHPERDLIAKRYLKYQRSLTDEALARLTAEETPDPDRAEEEYAVEEEVVERRISLNEQRIGAVVAALKASGARRILDLGCGEGRLLQLLMKEKQFTTILGMDVSHRVLEIAADRLNFERLPPMQRERISLIHGSLMYRDPRLSAFDAAACVEVIEHLDPPRLAVFERVVFEFARPPLIAITTPNAEYNVMWESLPAGKFRHRDHRFEWTRAEFETWAQRICARFGYTARFMGVGDVDAQVGSLSQMAVFELVQGDAA